MNWIFWLILVIVLSFVEIATVNLVSIWFVASGIVAMILSFFIEDTAIITTIDCVLQFNPINSMFMGFFLY